MALTRTDILNSTDLPVEPVKTPEWGAGSSVLVRTMSGVERDSFEQEMIDARKPGQKANINNIRARLAVRCVVDDTGARLFTDVDADALGKKSAKVLDRIFSTAQRLNGIGEADVDKLAGN